ncbi:hypothetical protein C8Q70DRAFT_609673 [Cubamyces menziesii]|nr:hypothetical protein C8Q70DRAFT_609673 [Cubamyces menziesii]
MVGHGNHDSPFLNLQEPTNVDRPALEPDGSIKIEDPSLQSYWQNHPNPYWPANLLGLGVAYFVHARIRRRLPRTFPTFTTLRLGELYGMLAVAHAAAQERLLYRTQVLQDPDLHTLEMVATRQRQRWTEIHDSVRQQPEYTQIKSFDLEMQRKAGISSWAWLRDHIWSDPVTYNFYYCELYERFADKYPDISAKDWDTCVTHIANTAESTDNVFISYAAGIAVLLTNSIPFAMLARWKRVPVLTPLLNGIQRTLSYAFMGFMIMQPYRHWAYPRTLQNKQRVAEMLNEAYADKTATNAEDATLNMTLHQSTFVLDLCADTASMRPQHSMEMENVVLYCYSAACLVAQNLIKETSKMTTSQAALRPPHTRSLASEILANRVLSIDSTNAKTVLS